MSKDWKRNIMFRPAAPLLPMIDERVRPGLSAHQVAKRDLTRYYMVLADSVPRLSDGERAAVRAALDGFPIDAYRLLWARIDDELLAAKLRALPAASVMALIDLLERE